MSKYDNDQVTSTIGAISGLIGAGVSSFFGYMSLDTVSQQLSSGGIDYWSEGTSETANSVKENAGGNSAGSSTAVGVFGLVSSITGGSSYAEPDAVIEVFTSNKKPYSKVEKRAKKVYDTYDKNHIKNSNEDASLIITSDEAAMVVNDIVSKVGSKEEFLSYLATLESVLQGDASTVERPVEKIKRYEK